MTLYIRRPGDDPHTQNLSRPAEALCGVPLIGAKEITEVQALVYLGDRRCVRCSPRHSDIGLRMGKAA